MAGREKHNAIMKECGLVLNDIDERVYRMRNQHRQHCESSKCLNSLNWDDGADPGLLAAH